MTDWKKGEKMSEKKTVLVTGGTRGIGKAVCKRLAADGYQVYLTYSSKPDLAEAVCGQIRESGGQAQSFALNVADWDAVDNFFATHIKNKVFLAALVNNAGITKDGLLVRMNRAQWEDVLAVNLSGTFVCLQQAAKIMMKQRFGRIVNMSSIAGQAGNAGQANYSASKAGVIGLTKTAARELASRGITVNAIAPGFIETDMTAVLPEGVREHYLSQIPCGRLGSVEDIAGACSFFCSPESGYVTGQVLGVNGGLSC